MITEIYNKGEIIANEGEAANSFFIIKKVNICLKHLFISKGRNFIMAKIIKKKKLKIRRIIWRVSFKLCRNKIIYVIKYSI